MKYSKSNPPLACFQNQSTWLKGARKNSTPVGILWHDTAAGNPNIARYVQPDDNAADRDHWINLLGTNKYKNDWNHIDHEAGLNCWIGKLADGTITTVQTGPWTTHPWGCGGGSLGSCNGYIKNNGQTTWINQHWIQFEICDDNYGVRKGTKEYFDAVFEEACQITAYLCSIYNIDPIGVVNFNNVTVPTILCHADSYKLKLGSNHGDVYSWFKQYDKDMESARKRVVEILADTVEEKTSSESNVYYRVRKDWLDNKSQVGAYKILKNAIKTCDEKGYGYHVFDTDGNTVYSAPQPISPQPDADVNQPNGLQPADEVANTAQQEAVESVPEILPSVDEPIINNDAETQKAVGNIFIKIIKSILDALKLIFRKKD